MTGFASIEQAIADIAAGKAVVVVDDADRENEGDLIFAAEKATPELVAFMVRYTSGFICVPLTEADCDRLELPPMYHVNQDKRGTAYTVSVDAREGVSTGISATDRAQTIALLADPSSTAADLTRPGHVVPLRARKAECCAAPATPRPRSTWPRLAGLRPAGVLCEIVSNDDGDMARLDELQAFAAEHGLTLITIADLVAYRSRIEKQVECVAEARIPTQHGEFRAVGYRSADRRRRARRAGPRRHRRRRARPGARALRVPHRRRLRLAALRLRPAARRGDRRGRRGGPRRRPLRPRARGSRASA